jgi:hypothetical protein
MNKRMNCAWAKSARGLALLAQTMAKNGPLGPTLAARHTHALERSTHAGSAWWCGIGRHAIQSSQRLPPQRGCGDGQPEGWQGSTR